MRRNTRTKQRKALFEVREYSRRFAARQFLTYILMASEGFGLSYKIGYPVGAAFAAVLFALYAVFLKKASGRKAQNASQTANKI